MIAPEIRSALTPNLIAIIGVGVALGILILDTTGRIESRLDRAIAESQADVRAFQAQGRAFRAQAAADRRAFQAQGRAFRAQAAADRRAHRASMDKFGKRMDELYKRMDEHRDYMQRLDERES